MMLGLLFAAAMLVGVVFFILEDKQIVEESYEASNPTPVATPEDFAMLGLSQQIEKDMCSPASIPSFDNSWNNHELKWKFTTEEKPKKSRKKSKKKTKKKPAKKSKKRK